MIVLEIAKKLSSIEMAINFKQKKNRFCIFQSFSHNKKHIALSASIAFSCLVSEVSDFLLNTTFDTAGGKALASLVR